MFICRRQKASVESHPHAQLYRARREEFETLKAEIKALEEEAGLAAEATPAPRWQAVTELTCFNAYDIRGEIGVTIDEDIAYRIGRAVAQHFGAKSVVIGSTPAKPALPPPRQRRNNGRWR